MIFPSGYLRRCLSLLPALVLSFSLLHCGAERAASATRENVVRMHLASDPASVTLIGKTDLNSEIIGMRLTDALVQYDSSMQLQPLLAERWELSSDSRQLTFHLRPNVRWHDGRSVSAADVLFTINKLREPETENRTWAPELKTLIDLQAPDELTVVATFSDSNPDRLQPWRVPILPAHMFEDEEDFFNGSYASSPIGCGPFRFVRYVRGQEIVLEANDDYWAGRPQIDRLEFKIYTDQQTAYQALHTGELDVMTMSGNLWTEGREADQAGRFSWTQYRRFTAWTLGWNQRADSPFSDARVRIAMVLALDRESFLREVTHGMAHLGATVFPPASPWADESISPYPYDPERASELLTEAGWVDEDGDGIREKDGTALSFTLLVPTSSQQLTEWLAAWQQDAWRALGADVEFEQIEWQTFRERRKAGRFGVAAQSFHFSSPDMYPLLHSSEMESGLNYWGVNDPQLDSGLERIRTTLDPTERLQVMFEVQRRLHESEPITALFFFDSPLAFDHRLQGVSPAPLGYANTIDGPRHWSWSTLELD